MNDGRHRVAVIAEYGIEEQARERARHGIEELKRKYANDPDAYVLALEEAVMDYAVSRARQLGHLM